MAQTDERYYATYCRLDTQSEDLVCAVNGDGTAMGMELQFEPQTYFNARGKECVRGLVKNPIGEPLSFLPATCARRFCDLHAQGWTVRITASAMGFTEETRTFWIEAAVIAYEPQYADALGAFAEGCFKRIAKGDRPDIRLSEKHIDAALADKNYFKGVRNTSYPSLKKGEIYYKKNQTVSESLIISGSENNIGCWVGTIIFWVVVIAAVVLIVRHFFF